MMVFNLPRTNFLNIKSLTLISLILGAVQPQDDDSCSHTWITRPKTNFPGGSLLVNDDGSIVSTLSTCQQQCLLQRGCMGLDVDYMYRSSEGRFSDVCYLIFSGSVNTDSQATHYELLRNTGSCPVVDNCTSSVGYEEKRKRRAVVVQSKGSLTLPQCVTACNDDENCAGFNWKSDACELNTNKTQKSVAATDGSYYERGCVPALGNGIRVVTQFFVDKKTPSAGPTAQPWTTRRPAAANAELILPHGIRPAYIVLIAMGLGCILLVIIAIIVLCNYPFSKSDEHFSSTDLHTRKPRTLKEENYDMETMTRKPTTFTAVNGYGAGAGDTYRGNGSLGDTYQANGSAGDAYRASKATGSIRSDESKKRASLDRQSEASEDSYKPENKRDSYGGYDSQMGAEKLYRDDTYLNKEGLRTSSYYDD